MNELAAVVPNPEQLENRHCLQVITVLGHVHLSVGGSPRHLCRSLLLLSLLAPFCVPHAHAHAPTHYSLNCPEH